MAPHFAAVSDPPRRLAFLQQMLAFAQHPYLQLADRALPFWVKLLQVRKGGGLILLCPPILQFVL